MDNKWWIVIAIASIFVIGMFVQKSYDTFSILASGSYNSDAACTFMTNIDPGANSWDFNDYSISSTKWISVDVNGDGIKETFAGYGSVSGSSSNICDSTNYNSIPYITPTALGGFKLKYGKSSNDAVNTPAMLIICSGTMMYRYRPDYGSSDIALTSCAGVCTPNWQTGSWGTCISGTQTRTVTDSNSCGITTGMPPTSQTCSITCTDTSWTQDPSTVCLGTAFTQTSNCGNSRSSTGTKSCVNPTCNTNADTNCDGHVDRTELGNIINSWIAGSTSRTDLAAAINAWMAG